MRADDTAELTPGEAKNFAVEYKYAVGQLGITLRLHKKRLSEHHQAQLNSMLETLARLYTQCNYLERSTHTLLKESLNGKSDDA